MLENLAGGLGFEPRFSESKSDVLPLDDPPAEAKGYRRRTVRRRSERWSQGARPMGIRFRRGRVSRGRTGAWGSGMKRGRFVLAFCWACCGPAVADGWHQFGKNAQ